MLTARTLDWRHRKDRQCRWGGTATGGDPVRAAVPRKTLAARQRREMPPWLGH